MRKIRRLLRALFREQRGVTTAEALMLLTLVCVVSLGGWKVFGKVLVSVISGDDPGEVPSASAGPPLGSGSSTSPRPTTGGTSSSPSAPRPTTPSGSTPTGGGLVVSGTGGGPLASSGITNQSCQGSSCRNGKCFAAGTLVHTEEGLRPIEEVDEGELLWSRDEETGEVALRRVAETIVTPDRPLVRVDLDDGTGVIDSLRVTPPHPFFTQRGWVAAKDLTLEDDVMLRSGGYAMVTAAESLNERVTVYNFEVEGFHTYFVGRGGLWVHNAYPEDEWHRGSFATPAASLDYHFKKHGASVGATTPEQYTRKAREFYNQNRRARGVQKKYVDGSVDGVVRYIKSGKYVDVAPDGTIVSFGTTGP